MSTTCHRCGAVLPSDSAAPCPRCLLRPSWDRPRREAITLGPGQLFDPPSVEDLNQHLVGYEVSELIGRGGMGAVYRGRQLSLDRGVAIKILPPSIAERPGFRERFAREARALAKLNHPNIVAVYDYGQAGPYAMLVMELVDGASLRDVLAQGKLTPEEAFEIVPQLCDALSFAHDQGVVHRDIKPENLLFEQHGRLKITDFGLAKMMSLRPVPVGDNDAEELTLEASTEELTQSIIGTIHYMAPEQIETPKNVDHRADIYALGVVFYEMLTGELPIGRFDPPSQRVEVDVRFDEIVLKALAKLPYRRYGTAAEVRRDFDTIHSHPNTTQNAGACSSTPAPSTPTITGRTVGDWLHEITAAIRNGLDRTAATASEYRRSFSSVASSIQGDDPAAFYGGLAFGVFVVSLLSTWFVFAAFDDDFAMLVWLPLSLLVTLVHARYCYLQLSKLEPPPRRSLLLSLTLRLIYFPIITVALGWPIVAAYFGWEEIYGGLRDPWQPNNEGAGWGRDLLHVGCWITIVFAAWTASLFTVHLIWPALFEFLLRPLVAAQRSWRTIVTIAACVVLMVFACVIQSRVAYDSPPVALLDETSNWTEGTNPVVDYSRYSPRDVARIKHAMARIRSRHLDELSRVRRLGLDRNQ